METENDFAIFGPINKVTREVVDIIGHNDHEGKMLLIVDDGHARNEIIIALNIITVVELTQDALQNESLSKVQSIGAASNRDITIKIIMPSKEEIMNNMKLKSKNIYPKLSKLLKIPIPAQCKKAGKNVRTR